MIMHIINPNSFSCPRCGGNLGIGKDQFGVYLQCLMCARSIEIDSAPGPAPSKKDHQSNTVINQTNLSGALSA